jgi:hypothetical protein
MSISKGPAKISHGDTAEGYIIKVFRKWADESDDCFELMYVKHYFTEEQFKAALDRFIEESKDHAKDKKYGLFTRLDCMKITDGVWTHNNSLLYR